MSAQGVHRRWTEALKGGLQFPLASGDSIKFLPSVDNQGSIEIGDGTTDMDLKVFLGASTDFCLFDVSAGHVQLDNAEINLGDNDEIEFGDAPDIQIQWNATYLQSGPVSGMWANAPSAINPDPNVYSVFYDDFHTYVESTDASSPWTADTGATAGTTVLGAAHDSNTPGNGFVELVTGATDNDFVQIRLGEATTGSSWNFAAGGLRTWFEVGFMVDSVTDVAVYIGMVKEDNIKMFVTDTGAENIGDGIYFRTLTATPTEIDFAINQTTTETEVVGNGATLATNTLTRVGFFTDGTTITPYFDGTAGTTTLHAAANFPTDEALTPAFGLISGSAGVKKLFIDYVKIVQMRA